jgi:hypothetical protein
MPTGEERARRLYGDLLTRGHRTRTPALAEGPEAQELRPVGSGTGLAGDLGLGQPSQSGAPPGTWTKRWITGAPETTALAVVVVAACAAMGWVMRYHYAYAPPDALARTAKAVYVAASRDPHIGAIGFYWPPLPTLVEIPFVLALRPAGRMDFAGPLTTAIWAGIGILVLSRICTELQLRTSTRFALCLLYAANPFVFIYGINGMSEEAMYVCLLLTMLGWTRWLGRRSMLDLALVSVAMAAGVMTRLESLPVIIVLALLMGAGRDPWRWLMTSFTAVLPAATAVFIWMMVQLVLLGDPLAFLNGGRPHGTKVPPQQAGPSSWDAAFRYRYALPSHTGLLPALLWAATWVVVLAPVLILVLAAGVIRWRAFLYGALGFLGAALVFPALQLVRAVREIGFGDPRYFSETIPIAAVAAAWLVAELSATATVPRLSHPGGRARHGALLCHVPTVGVLTVVGLGAIATAAYIHQPRRTAIGMEYKVIAALEGDPISRGNVLASAENVTRVLDPYLANGQRAILDTDQNFLPVLVSRHPNGFIIQEDRDFRSILDHPDGKFQYLLVPHDGSGANVLATLLNPAESWKLIGTYPDPDFAQLDMYHYVG